MMIGVWRDGQTWGRSGQAGWQGRVSDRQVCVEVSGLRVYLGPICWEMGLVVSSSSGWRIALPYVLSNAKCHVRVTLSINRVVTENRYLKHRECTAHLNGEDTDQPLATSSALSFSFSSAADTSAAIPSNGSPFQLPLSHAGLFSVLTYG